MCADKPETPKSETSKPDMYKPETPRPETSKPDAGTNAPEDLIEPAGDLFTSLAKAGGNTADKIDAVAADPNVPEFEPVKPDDAILMRALYDLDDNTPVERRVVRSADYRTPRHRSKYY